MPTLSHSHPPRPQRQHVTYIVDKRQMYAPLSISSPTSSRTWSCRRGTPRGRLEDPRHNSCRAGTQQEGVGTGNDAGGTPIVPHHNASSSILAVAGKTYKKCQDVCVQSKRMARFLNMSRMAFNCKNQHLQYSCLPCGVLRTAGYKESSAALTAST